MSAQGRPIENGVVELFMRIFKEEHIDYTEHRKFTDSMQQTIDWLEVEYMTERNHSALTILTPTEFEAQVRFPQPETS